jgi:hypothetical protein
MNRPNLHWPWHLQMTRHHPIPARRQQTAFHPPPKRCRQIPWYRRQTRPRPIPAPRRLTAFRPIHARRPIQAPRLCRARAAQRDHTQPRSGRPRRPRSPPAARNHVCEECYRSCSCAQSTPPRASRSRLGIPVACANSTYRRADPCCRTKQTTRLWRVPPIHRLELSHALDSPSPPP